MSAILAVILRTANGLELGVPGRCDAYGTRRLKADSRAH